MKKVIAVISSDWHIHKFKNFDIDNSRLEWSLKAGREILTKARVLGVPHLFCGDLLHTPKDGDNETVTSTFNLFAGMPDVITYGVSGNHDMSEKNGGKFLSPSWLDFFDTLPFFNQLDRNLAPYEQGKKYDCLIEGINYYNDNGELLKYLKEVESRKYFKNSKGKKILMLHSDMPGATTPVGIELEEAYAFRDKNLDKLFKHWDLVICGHIHKPQRLSKKVYMIGPPIHQISSDEGQKFGYWELYDDLSMKHIHLDKFPHFYTLKENADIPFNVNDRDYIIRDLEELVEEDTQGTDGLFHLNKGRKKLAKTYTKVKGIKSKSKTKALITALTNVE